MVDRELRISIGELDKRASLWDRSLAYVLDVFIMLLVIFLPFHYSFKLINNRTPFFETLWLTPLIIFYFAITEKEFGSSLGKMILNLKIKSLKGELKPWQALLRNLTKFSPVLLLIDTINCFLNKDNQRFSEVWAGTKVIKE